MTVDLDVQIRDLFEEIHAGQTPVTIDEVEQPMATVFDGPGSVPQTAIRRDWAVGLAAAALVLAAGLLTLLTRGTAPEAPVVSQPSPTPTVAAPAPVPSTPVEGSVSGWSRIPYDEAVFGEGFEQVMDSVTVGGPGLVAVGSAGFADWRAAVWTSVDGVVWSRVPDIDAVFGAGVMHSVTAGGPGLVAVGTSDQATVWTSPDGFNWSRVPDNEAVFGGGEAAFGRQGVDYAAMNDVTAGGPGLVAVGIKVTPGCER